MFFNQKCVNKVCKVNVKFRISFSNLRFLLRACTPLPLLFFLKKYRLKIIDRSYPKPVNMAYSDAEPITNVNILQTEISRLVEDLVVENVLPGVLPFLSRDEQDKIEGGKTQSERSLLLINCLDHRNTCQSFEAFNAFMMTLAGTQPELFTILVNRPATPVEVDICVKKYSIELKKRIAETGHKTDSPLDEAIDFDTQYIQLHIIKNHSGGARFAKTDTEDLYQSGNEESLPHQYQKRLSEVENRGAKVPICNILNIGKTQAKRVLLSGRAGVGKTTTLQWLAQQWAPGRWATGFTLLFLIQLRMLSNTYTNNISAIELLTLYGFFQLTTEGSQQVLYSWLKNAADRVVILVDGLDEIAGFSQKLKNCLQITDLNQKAHPIDLCINIIRGDLLPGCTIIFTSRPFTGLCTLSTDTVLEILGLTHKQVKEYVEKKYHKRSEHVMSVLHRNPMLMSVCGITFYCMAVSTLLSQGIEILDEEVKTYTRLTAFIIVQYVTRKLSEWPFVIQVRSYFPKLAHLAEIGIFQSKENQGLPRLIFNEYDLSEVGLTPSDLESVKKGGILNIKEVKTGKRNYIYAEFLHLTMQEMLAVAHLLPKPSRTEEVLRDVFSSNQFNMARMYLFGLQYDEGSDWIMDVCRAVSPSGLCADSDNSANISEFLKTLCTGQMNKLLVCQLVHESQMEELARSVVDYVAPDGVLTIERTPMTAIDVGAVAFVCQYPQTLTNIILKGVNADKTFMKVMSSFLIQPHITSLQSLDVSNNYIGSEGAVTLAAAVHQSHCLKELDISYNRCIGDDGAKALAEALLVNVNLICLCVMANGIGVDGMLALAKAMFTNTSLKQLDVSYNVGDESSRQKCFSEISTQKSVIFIGMKPDGTETATQTETVTQDLHIEKCEQELNFSGSYICDNGAKTLARALCTNERLTALYLQMNGIGPDGAKALADALHTNPCLQALDLEYNQISDEGTKALARTFCTNKSLTTLDLRTNDIGPDGAKALAEALHTNTCLQELELSGNYIGDEGAKALARALCTNECLTTFGLRINYIGPEGAKALAEAMNTNRCLRILDVSINPIGDEGIKAIVTATRPVSNTLNIIIYNEKVPVGAVDPDCATEHVYGSLKIHQTGSVQMEQPLW